jgi:hypothetical protein
MSYQNAKFQKALIEAYLVLRQLWLMLLEVYSFQIQYDYKYKYKYSKIIFLNLN